MKTSIEVQCPALATTALARRITGQIAATALVIATLLTGTAFASASTAAPTATIASVLSTDPDAAQARAGDAETPTRCALPVSAGLVALAGRLPVLESEVRCDTGDMGCWRAKCCRTVGWPECCGR